MYTDYSTTPVSSINVTSVLIGLILLGFLAVVIAILGYIGYIFYKNRKREDRSIDSVLLQVAVQRSNEVKIDAMEQIFAVISSFKKSGWKQKFDVQPTVSFELVAQKEDIRFFVWVPKKYQDLIEKTIHGAYTDAEIIAVPEYNIFTEEGKVAYKSFQLKKDNFYPIRLYKDMPIDPLSAITSALAKMGEGEAAAIQVVLSPTEIPWSKAGRDFISTTKKNESDPEKAKFSVPAKTLEAVENKISKPGFETTIRMVVVSQSEDIAKAHLTNISASFEQFNGDLNGLGGRKIKNKGAFIEDFLYRYQPMFNWNKNHASVLNTEELATIFHFPNKQITTPHIYWLNAKSAPAPAEIPNEGLFLGVSDFRGIRRPVYISEADRLRHMYIIGKTGVGKSELLTDMMMQDIRAGKGLCFIDPHGDAAEKLLELIPPERAEDVIYFDPGDTGRPMGINLLEAKTIDEKHFVATSIINLMYKLFDPYKTGIVGPRFEHGVRNAILTALAVPGSTFIEVMKLLQNPGGPYLQKYLDALDDQMVREYWTEQIAHTSEFHKSETLDYTVSKFGRFVTNKTIRNIIGQTQSAFSFREVMDSGKILIVNLAKGKLGEENSNFLGLILVPRILMAAMSRQDTPEDQRRDFYLYVDEFQNFATPDFAVILSEARKYHLGLCVANQFIGQVEEEVKNAIFGNVGTKISFIIGVSDASYMAHEFAPVFSEDDLLNIEKYHAYVKTIVKNEPVPPFSIDVTKDMEAEKKLRNPRVAEIIKEMSRLKYGKDERLVDAEIARRSSF